MGGSIAGGDFDRFFEQEKRMLLRQAYLLTGDAQEAQDLAQEALFRAWRSWDRVSTLESPSAWTRHVLHNLAVSSWRRRQTRRRHATHSLESDVPSPDIGHLDVAAALRSLPANQRDALVLRTVVGMSAAEVAVELGTTEATVRSWLSRARRDMAKALSLSAADPHVSEVEGRER